MVPQFKRVFAAPLIFVAVVLATASTGCLAKSAKEQLRSKPGQNTPEESWYVVKISGSPVGFANETKHVLADGTINRTHMDLALSRMGTLLNIFMSATEFDDTNGRIRSIDVEMKASSMAMKISGTLEGDTIYLRTESPGFAEEQRIAWEHGAMGQAASNDYIVERLRAGEVEFSFRTFDPQAAEFTTITVKKIKTDPEEIDGEVQQLIAVEEYEDDDEFPRSTTWFDQAYQPVRTVFLQMGLEIVLERVAPEQIEQIELEPNFDIIRQSMIPCNGYPGDPGGIKDVTMRLQFRRHLAADRDFSGPNQNVLSRGEDWVEILVSRETITRTRLSRDQQDVFLRPDRFIQSEHPSIQTVVDSIRTETNAEDWELAHALAVWVNRHIKNKNFEKGFASALEVLDTESGDCTEHAVLLTALLRAAGIPARPAVGLAYANGSFVGHMWTEAYVDHWRMLDAIDLSNDPIRIRISTSEDGRAVNEKELVRAYDVVGGMRVDVTDCHANAAE